MDRVQRAAEPLVNLYSDTQTRPTDGMRRAMANAEVGDEQRMADPTVNELCDRVADLLDYEAAVFMPSGTMCNEVAVRVHVRPLGDAVYLHRTSHVLQFEGGAPAAFSGAVLVPLDGDRGMFEPDTLRAAVPEHESRYSPRPRLVCVEQTTNVGGGAVWPQSTLRAVIGVAGERGLMAHMDGARLFNAVVASGVPAAGHCQGFDSAWVDFTKGLGAPMGAVLAGSAAFVEEAWRCKQMLGGAMRQAGIVAAGALYALDHHVERLADDHANARRLAEGLAEIGGVDIDPAGVETNIVVFRVADAPALVAALEREGVSVSALDSTTVRAVTHLDVSTDAVDTALAGARAAMVASSHPPPPD